jgi:hypothetical protein
MIENYLEDLERRLTPEVEENLWDEWRAFADGRCREEVFSPRRPEPAPPSVAWPHVLVNDALEDFEAMALQQLELCSNALAEGTGALLAVRCNYGTGILPSLFGGERFLMDREIDTLPACRPLDGGAEAVKRVVAKGIPDRDAGQGARTFEMGRYFVRLLADYPRLRRHVHLYHPDLQGPINVCEMLWGSSLYVDLYDKPDLVREFLALITETYVRFMKRWEEMTVDSSQLTDRSNRSSQSPVPRSQLAEGSQLTTANCQPTTSCAVHWSMLHRGRIMVRNDAATNLSPAMYDEFIRPFDQRLLEELGGGAIHFCGRGDHLIGRMAQLPGLYAINTTQPGLNNVEVLLRSTVDRGINLIGFDRDLAVQAVQQRRPLKGRVHCW